VTVVDPPRDSPGLVGVSSLSLPSLGSLRGSPVQMFNYSELHTPLLPLLDNQEEEVDKEL